MENQKLDKNLNETVCDTKSPIDKQSLFLPVEQLAISESDCSPLTPSRSTWYHQHSEHQLENSDKIPILGRNHSADEIPDYILNTNQSKRSPLKLSSRLNGSVPHLPTFGKEQNQRYNTKSSASPDNSPPTRYVKLRNKSSGNSPFHLRAEKAASVYGDSLQSAPKKQRPRSSIFASSAIMRRPRNSLTPSGGLTLLNVLDNKKMRTTFLDFLESEYSSENLLFWLSCEKFRKLKSEEQRMREAQHIYSEYISPNAPNQVNIDHLMRRQLTVALTSQEVLPLDVFDNAKRYVFSIMENDSFPRFVTSSYYKDVPSGKMGAIESVFSNFLPGSKSSNSSRGGQTKHQLRNSNNNNSKTNPVHPKNEESQKPAPKLTRRFSFGFKKTHSVTPPKPNRFSASDLTTADDYFKVELKIA